MPAVPFSYKLRSLANWVGPVNAGSGCLSCIATSVRGKVLPPSGGGGGGGGISIECESKTVPSASLIGFVDPDGDPCDRFLVKTETSTGFSSGNTPQSLCDDPDLELEHYGSWTGTSSRTKVTTIDATDNTETSVYNGTSSYYALYPDCIPNRPQNLVFFSCVSSIPENSPTEDWIGGSCGEGGSPIGFPISNPSTVPVSPCFDILPEAFNGAPCVGFNSHETTYSSPDTIEDAIARAPNATTGTACCASTGAINCASIGPSTSVTLKITGTGTPNTTQDFTIVFATNCAAEEGQDPPPTTYETSEVTLSYGEDGEAAEQSLDVPQPGEDCSTCVACIIGSDPVPLDPDDATQWGADEEAQFPPAWNEGYYPNQFLADARYEGWSDIPTAITGLIAHPNVGRFRLAVSDTYYPGQAYAFSWDVVTRALGYGIKRSQTECGTTQTTSTRTYTLEEALTAPEDSLGPMGPTDGSWDDLDSAIVRVPPTPSGTGNSATGGFFAAGPLRRSKVRFAVLVPGSFTFKIRKVEVDTSDPNATPVSTLATLVTSGTLGNDGTNSTSEVHFQPSLIENRAVYLFIDSVKNSLGVLVTDWLALAKERDGYTGFFRRFDEPDPPVAPLFYKRFKFTQTTTITATAGGEDCDPPPDPPDPDPEENPCSAGGGEETPPPLLSFTQTQVWVMERGSGWKLLSSSGSGGGASWSNEVTHFDPPDMLNFYPYPDLADDDWTVSATSASKTDTSESASALRAEFARVFPTPNGYFGGKVQSISRSTSSDTLKTYGDEDYRVTSTIVSVEPAEGTAIQLATPYVRAG